MSLVNNSDESFCFRFVNTLKSITSAMFFTVALSLFNNMSSLWTKETFCLMFFLCSEEILYFFIYYIINKVTKSYKYLACIDYFL